ncbi:MAG: hypothetical protein PHO37_04755 [Kiritimatiellae bacterium]|nr:hypothetical protein [Kiritimatiellia bacterium]
MAKKDAFVESSKKRFKVAEASEVQLGMGGTFRATEVGTLSSSDKGIP